MAIVGIHGAAPAGTGCGPSGKSRRADLAKRNELVPSEMVTVPDAPISILRNSFPVLCALVRGAIPFRSDDFEATVPLPP
jgi:hypothetical protein